MRIRKTRKERAEGNKTSTSVVIDLEKPTADDRDGKDKKSNASRNPQSLTQSFVDPGRDERRNTTRMESRNRNRSNQWDRLCYSS